VLVEINCETDFVARTDDFKEFARNIAMHIAASAPLCVRREDVDPELVEKERAIFEAQAKKDGKPEKIIQKIVDGKIEKYYNEIVLLEQPYVKDTDKSVGDLVKETIGSLGENIQIKRFTRFRLGE
jgi:elongation factor Ts